MFWKRPSLSPDQAVLTVSALLASESFLSIRELEEEQEVFLSDG